MNKEMYQEKKESYHDLLVAVYEMYSLYKDYTPEKEEELESQIKEACNKCDEINLPEGKTIFNCLKGYIIHRYKELNEYKARREKEEQSFLSALPDVFDQLAVSEENSCEKVSTLIEKHVQMTNYQVLVDNMIRIISKW